MSFGVLTVSLQMADAADRLFVIRQSLGTPRDPMPLRAFAALILEETGVRVDPTEISRKETRERKITLTDVALFAAVDPERRGKLWLGWGETTDPLLRVPEAEEGEEMDEAAERAAMQSRAAKKPTRKRA